MARRDVDVVLVNPGNRMQIYQGLGTDLSAIECPIWAGLIATFLRQKGAGVAVIDAEAEDLTPEQVAARIASLKPRLVAVVVYGHQPSASTQHMPAAGAICTAIKHNTPDQPVLLVGGHVAALPERTLREEDADFVCGGEGPYTIWELLQALSASPRDVRRVRGLWYRDNGTVAATPPAPLVKDLDAEMPGVAWDLLPMERYRAHNWHSFGRPARQPYAALYTTLGCPYHCSFCCIQAPFKSGEQAMGQKPSVNSYRFWSPDTVLAQLDVLVKDYGIRNVKIADEMFVLHPGHVLGLSERIIERGYNLNFWAYARVDTVREGMDEVLKRAGFHWLAFGIEAASERVREDMQKGFSQEKIFQTIGRVRAAGINVIGNYIFGLPEDTLTSMQATLDLALELNCEFANFYSAMAYPGSGLYERALQAGWSLPKAWSGYSQHSVDSLPLPTKYVSGSEVLRFRDHAFQTYFSHPRYLEMIQRTFGSAAAQHVRDMVSNELVREYA